LDATHKDIDWNVTDAGGTDATIGYWTEVSYEYRDGQLIKKEYLSIVLLTPDAGTIVVTATIRDGAAPGADYTKDFTITVNPVFVPVTDITGVPTTATAGTQLALTGSVAPADATNRTIAWRVKDAGDTGATISGGTFNAMAAGTATVTATIEDGTALGVDYTKDFIIAVSPAQGGGTGNGGAGGDNNGNDGDNGGTGGNNNGGSGDLQQISAPGDVPQVNAPGAVQQTSETPVAMANISAAKVPMAPGTSSALPKSVAFTDGVKSDVKWSSGAADVARIDADGKLIAVDEGTATLTATATDGSGKSETVTVTIAKPVTAVRTPLTTIYLTKGMGLTPPVCADSVDAQGKADIKAKLTYKSSNPKIATVDANGKIKVKGAGKAAITVTALNGKSAKITVNAVAKAKKLKKLALTKAPKTIKLGKTAVLKLKPNPAAATNLKIKFKVSGKAIKVDQAGKITALKKGKSKITVTAGGKKATYTVTVK
jgi:uncharacterized protein YjdB